jgi:hypothetical protein
MSQASITLFQQGFHGIRLYEQTGLAFLSLASGRAGYRRTIQIFRLLDGCARRYRQSDAELGDAADR